MIDIAFGFLWIMVGRRAGGWRRVPSVRSAREKNMKIVLRVAFSN